MFNLTMFNVYFRCDILSQAFQHNLCSLRRDFCCGFHGFMSIFRCDILSQAFRYVFTKKRFVPVVATVFSLTAGLEILVSVLTN